jgi:hypothetical protein
LRTMSGSFYRGSSWPRTDRQLLANEVILAIELAETAYRM